VIAQPRRKTRAASTGPKRHEALQRILLLSVGPHCRDARHPVRGPDRNVGGGCVPWTSLAELRVFAANGHPRACTQLGEQMLRGDGVAQDVPQALKLLTRAATAGYGPAALFLGNLYDKGQNVPADRTRALAYYRAAAAAGQAEAFYNLGAAYSTARGVKRDYAEGLAWLILAAKRGTGADAEQALRTRLEKLRRPDWITAAEARAPAIERELAAAKPADILPSDLAPAPLTPLTTAPTTPERPALPKPALTVPAPVPTLPPPTLAPPKL